MLTINIIGAGRLGQTLGKLITLKKAGIIQGVCNRSLKSSTLALEFIGQGQPYLEISQLPPADISLITTQDAQIKSAALALSKAQHLKEKSCVIHCSGVLSSRELESLKSKNCFIASLHPMRSFANPALSVEKFNNTYCAVEGDKEAIAIIEPLFHQLGEKIFCINPDKKSLYHAAAAMASNYLVTLCNEATFCLTQSGIEEDMAMGICTSLMQSTLDNLVSTHSPKQALTGPIKRGEIETLTKHKEALGFNKELLQFYREMGLATLKLAGHDKEKEILLRDLLGS